MDKLEQYRDCVKQVIRKRENLKPSYGDIEIQMIFDDERSHYQLVHVGWFKKERQYGCLIHVDVRDDKIWVQYDGTEAGVAEELVELGVPHEDIVLGYFRPVFRAYTDYAVG